MTHLSVRSTARTQLVDVTSLVGEAIVGATGSVGIPLFDGALALGEHQAIILAEFDGPRDRTLSVTVA